ncbi:PREDICTED: uncharacterized protein LOC108772090 [Cyphomyrmex costatus]|uniref:uncharacterized protein LOC108772090 n=1 Tax=Cyphomyrmex costatus TaxID=456900 RepID=UPI000852316E|nr:PREDICTED: uncharacterized protein LOC108772090 [Cyphomyrmex costatus]
MAYNLRQRSLREELLETQYDETDFGGEVSDNEEDNGSDYEHDPDADLTDTEQEEDEFDDELEDAPPTKRMLLREEEEDELDSMPLGDRLQSRRRSRGRPQSKLFGKGGKGGKDRFVWNLNPSTRKFGKFSEQNISEQNISGHGKVHV